MANACLAPVLGWPVARRTVHSSTAGASRALRCALGVLSRRVPRLFCFAVPRAAKALPFFVYALVTEDIIVARGRSGGLALWARADSDWMAKAGVLQVYK